MTATKHELEKKALIWVGVAALAYYLYKFVWPNVQIAAANQQVSLAGALGNANAALASVADSTSTSSTSSTSTSSTSTSGTSGSSGQTGTPTLFLSGIPVPVVTTGSGSAPASSPMPPVTQVPSIYDSGAVGNWFDAGGGG